MDLKLNGKHVLITGGSKGIGLACAREFLQEGCTVSLVGRDQARLAQVCEELDVSGQHAHGLTADLTDAKSALAVVTQAEAAYGPIDVLVNAAGAARQKPFRELEPQDWRGAMDAKFFTYINVMDPLIKLMAARGHGAIVNVIGMGGKIPITTHLIGGAANAALMLATAGLALAYAPQGVRVNALNPSKTSTGRLVEGVEADARQRNITEDAAMIKARESLPIGRIATPEDVAAAVVFLASPRAGYISGSVLSMDGATRPMVV
ncbi:SDR family NAD(P)-dependent oxidoreductase [Variovorax sp. HJSM1_2]|uniref:SDR family NAD(P)-dependent oxidoreductase n=1 Tax=Variovorax sp. HJSM1_2 TaxID=3366263 RepID=UPI003BEA65AC